MKAKNDTRYENSLFINKYIALWAYGYINGFGDAEGLYSCIARMCTLLEKKPKRILDIGCGIGRTTFDLAQIFPYAEILGMAVGTEGPAKSDQAGAAAPFRRSGEHFLRRS